VEAPAAVVLCPGDFVKPSAAPAAERRRNEKAKRQYYVNMGHAIRTLREELPVVFYREPSFGIYR
jgi:hypothetical protein